jgi:hypothetical protein
MIDIHAFTSKQKCYIIVEINTYKKGPMHNDIKSYIYIHLVSQLINAKPEWTEPHFFQDEAPFLHSFKIHEEVLRC